MTNSAAERSVPACKRCQHYFITYDPHFPYGCRALGMKSKVPPVRAVEEASGLPCQSFMPREKEPQ